MNKPGQCNVYINSDIQSLQYICENQRTFVKPKRLDKMDNMTNKTNTSSLNNISGEIPEIPREFLFNDDSLVSVITYSVLFAVAAVGNLTVFVILFKHRHRKSRVNLFIMHLCIADLIVTFIMLPMEIGWHVTVAWTAGDFGCRFLMFFRTFGFYLSSFILIAISLDRYFAVKHPLSLTDASKRGKIMLSITWACSAVASAPQVGGIYYLLFSVDTMF